MQHPILLAAAAAAIGASNANLLPAQSLRGSRASVDLMYARAHASDLDFFRTPDGVYTAVGNGNLKLISVTEDVDLERVSFPFVLPRTLDFVNSLAKRYHAACGERLVVTSGARPTDEQPRNASPKSVHPTGMAVDFHKPGGACLTWLRKELVSLEDQRLIEATEERHPPHFHVAVLRQTPVQLAAASPLAPKTTESSAAGEVGTPIETGRSALGTRRSASSKPHKPKSSKAKPKRRVPSAQRRAPSSK